MQIEISEWVQALRVGLDLVPPALFAVVVLGGPTLGWVLYRIIVQPRASRTRLIDLTAMWVCSNCRSVNELRMAHCYRCDARPDETDLEVIDTHPAGPARRTAVGPGLDLDRPGRPMTRPGLPDLGSALGAGIVDPTMTGMPYLAMVADPMEEPDPLMLPDVFAMTGVAETRVRRRSPKARDSVPVGPGKPAAARRRRATTGGKRTDPDAPPAA